MNTNAFNNRFIALARANIPPTAEEPPYGIVIHRVASFDERTDAFWAEAARPYFFAVDRTREYLNWRFDRRAGQFQILLAELDRRVQGYAVSCIREGVGYVADIMTLPGPLNVARTLLIDVLTALARTGASHVECWLPTRHPYRHLLGELGFVRSERQLRFRYTPVGLTRAELEPLRHHDTPIHLSASDTDLI